MRNIAIIALSPTAVRLWTVLVVLAVATCWGCQSMLRTRPVAAAKADASTTIRRAREQLRDPDVSRQVEAITTLGRLGPAARVALPDLLRVAKEAPPSVRMEVRLVFSGLEDALVEVALSHDDPSLRAEAVAWVDKDRLEAIVRGASDNAARVALERIDNAELLANLALSGPERFRVLAAAKISDAALLAQLARKGDKAVRRRVIGQLKDPGLLGKLARAEDRELRADATARLLVLVEKVPVEEQPGIVGYVQDRSALLSIARTGPAKAALALAESTDDVEILAVLATRAETSIVRKVVSRSEEAQVIKAAATHPDEMIRLEVLRQTGDVDIIAAAARGDASARVRLFMATRLTGTKTLRQISRSDKNKTVRRLAAFLVLRRDRGTKPTLAFELREGDKFQGLVRSTLRALLRKDAILFECKPQLDCALFSKLVSVEVSVSDSNQCYRSSMFPGLGGLGGSCEARGKDVHVNFQFFRDGQYDHAKSFSSRTPESFKTRSYGDAIKLYPSAGEIWWATKKAVKRDAQDWYFESETAEFVSTW